MVNADQTNCGAGMFFILGQLSSNSFRWRTEVSAYFYLMLRPAAHWGDHNFTKPNI
jgi:hypothetical protein